MTHDRTGGRSVAAAPSNPIDQVRALVRALAVLLGEVHGSPAPDLLRAAGCQAVAQAGARSSLTPHALPFGSRGELAPEGEATARPAVDKKGSSDEKGTHVSPRSSFTPSRVESLRVWAEAYDAMVEERGYPEDPDEGRGRYFVFPKQGVAVEARGPVGGEGTYLKHMAVEYEGPAVGRLIEWFAGRFPEKGAP